MCVPFPGCGGRRIYDDRARQGFSGCVAYDCQGAGQRVVQQVFAGHSSRDDSALMAPMLRAFETMRAVHGLLARLHRADGLVLAPAEREVLAGLTAALDPAQGWTAHALSQATVAALTDHVRAFVAPFRDQLLEATAAEEGGHDACP